MNIRQALSPVTRRGFVMGAAATGIAASLGRLSAEAAQPDALRGTHFELMIDEQWVNLTGKRRRAAVVNGSLPGPTLRWREGDAVTVGVTNRLRETTSIHWHGIRLPASMDGVPGLSFDGIAPGERFVYRIPVRQRGTYWYHSHSGFQEQTGLYGALIVEGRSPEPFTADREHILLLSDWTDTNPETVFSNLKQQSDYYNHHRATVGDFLRSAHTSGLGAATEQATMWGRMNMSPSDIADVTGAAYTYLLNGQTPRSNWTGLFRAGERLRLRIINGSSMTFFDLRIPGLTMTVIEADGNAVEPVEVDEFRIAPAEIYDVLVEPDDERAYTIFAQSEDRSGFARGTLAPRAGMVAAIPAMDPRPVRTMTDMGMNMGSMNGMAMGGMVMNGEAKNGKTGDSPIIARQSAQTNANALSQTGIAAIQPLPQPAPGVRPVALPAVAPPSEFPASGKPEKSHARLRLGPQVDNVAAVVSERLNQPGDGLDGNGRRVLTYADLRARYDGVDPRPPSRTITLHLSGNMERYVWGFDGKKFSDAQPIRLSLGERVRITLINDTMMEHPIHLHGFWSELETDHGARNPYKHTVIVKPAERVSYCVTADTPGRWAFHCHLLYHMEAGMFRVVEVG